METIGIDIGSCSDVYSREEKIVRKVYNITKETENRYPHKNYLENIEKEYNFIIRNGMWKNHLDKGR
jgi:hypothetical protein